MYPLLEVNPFPWRMRIYIKARFRTPAGQILSGYVINADADPAVGIFCAGEEFVFNRYLRDHCRDDEAALRELLPDPADTVFPLTYETDFTDDVGNRIEGLFDFQRP